MNARRRQIIAEKIASTVRVLELLGLNYDVRAPKNLRAKGNKSPRVVEIKDSKPRGVKIYNSYRGSTWANERTGRPIAEVSSIEDLRTYLKKMM